MDRKMTYTKDEVAQLLERVTSKIAVGMRGTMANVYAAANRLAPMEAREQDEAIDRNAAIFTRSYYQMMRMVINLTDVQELVSLQAIPTAKDSIAAVCQEICVEASDPFEQAGVTLCFESDCIGHEIAFNRELIEKLLLHLLSNALKFTPEGGSVTVRVNRGDMNTRISVEDTGRGISDDRIGEVFDLFLQSGRIDPPPHGLGVGLSICRDIVQLHGGRIFAEAKSTEGATINISLPNSKAETGQMPRTTYTGGFNRILLGLADALPCEAYLHYYLD